MAKAKRYGDGPIHRQTSLTVNGEMITCDRGVAPLIRRLREAGFTTLYSCQGSWGYDLPYVAMESTGDLDVARDIIRRFWRNCIVYEVPWYDDRVNFYALKSKFQIRNRHAFDKSFRHSRIITGEELIRDNHEQQ